MIQFDERFCVANVGKYAMHGASGNWCFFKIQLLKPLWTNPFYSGGSGMKSHEISGMVTNQGKLGSGNHEKCLVWMSREVSKRLVIGLTPIYAAKCLYTIMSYMIMTILCTHTMHVWYEFTYLINGVSWGYNLNLLISMSPQNHEKWRFWPPKNQVIYHKNL